MYYFLNDYGEIAHPNLLEAIAKTNLIPEDGYFGDSHSDEARKLIQKELGNSKAALIDFVPGGTLANIVAISAFLRPHQAVIAPRSAHIYMHETGAIEASGHKVIDVCSKDGKITPEQIKDIMEEHQGEHMVSPKLVFITNATELGTIYTKAELERLHKCCKEYQLILYCDGARLGAALTALDNDLTMSDIADNVDAFYIGGTKNGALAGEAFVIMNPELTADFRFILKQRGGLMAKGKVIGIQFEELFRNGLFYELAERENRMAEKIVKAMKEKGYTFWVKPQSNQFFPILSCAEIKRLQEKFCFSEWEKVDGDRWAARFVTSWATTEEAVEALISSL